MMSNFWFVIWDVCSSYLTVLSRYKEQLLTCYLVCYFSHLSFVMMYHGCHVLVLGVLLHIETSTLFQFSHKLVRHARYQKKRGKSALILHTRVKTTIPRPEIKTVANMHHRGRCFFIDNVAFAKENTNETYQAIKNWSVAAPKIASLATDTEKQTKNYDQYQESSFCKAKKQKQQANRKLLTRSTFCNINTQGGSKDVIQTRPQRPESPAVTHLTCV